MTRVPFPDIPDEPVRRNFEDADSRLDLANKYIDSLNTSVATIEAALAAALPACRVYNNAAITISNTTFTALTFNSERYDTNTMHSTSSNTGRITFVTAGKYTVVGNIEWATHATGGRILAIRLNGSTYIGLVTQTTAGTGIGTAQCVTTEYDFAANDYVELVVYQDSGGNLNVQVPTGQYSPEFMAAKIATVGSGGGGGGAPSGPAGGDLSGTYPNPDIAAGVIVDADINASGISTRSKLPSQLAYEDESNSFSVQQLFADGSAGSPGISNIGDTDTGIYFGAANEVDVSTGGTKRLGITSAALTAVPPVQTGDGTFGGSPVAAHGFTSNPPAGMSILSSTWLVLMGLSGTPGIYIDSAGGVSFNSPPSLPSSYYEGYGYYDSSAAPGPFYLIDSDYQVQICVTAGFGGTLDFYLPDTSGMVYREKRFVFKAYDNPSAGGAGIIRLFPQGADTLDGGAGPVTLTTTGQRKEVMSNASLGGWITL